MPVNEYGTYVRDLRKKNGHTLIDMANLMSCSISFLSAMECGSKTIPLDIADRVAKVYNLNEEEIKDLRNKIDLSNNRIQISLDEMSEEKKDVCTSQVKVDNRGSNL